MDSLQAMSSSSSSTVPSSGRMTNFMSQTEVEMESSKARHWSQLDYSTSDTEWSTVMNYKYFDVLKEHPQFGRFFTDFHNLEVGERIGAGAQADVYEARMTPFGPFDLVVKVMKGDAPLQAFEDQWPVGMLSARAKHTHLYDLPLITILGGTVLEDRRRVLRGRFAFVMYRRWGDLRLLIDRRMKQERTTRGPFPIHQAIQLMLSIAEDMCMLHDKHGILHRDLKASNVLVWGESGEDLSLAGSPDRVERLGSVVADFECSVGVLGTGLWRAPEILQQLTDRVPRSNVNFTRESDVYSYGMTCYEIMTGCLPFAGLGGEDSISQILKGLLPEWPLDLPEDLRDVILGCWNSDPWTRPTFSVICYILKGNRCSTPVSIGIDNDTERGTSVVKVDQWKNPQRLTLLQLMQKLMDMDVSLLQTFSLSSTETITQYFEVTDCKGRKRVNGQSIANIVKVVSYPFPTKESEELSHDIELTAGDKADILKAVSKALVPMRDRVISARYTTRVGEVKILINEKFVAEHVSAGNSFYSFVEVRIFCWLGGHMGQDTTLSEGDWLSLMPVLPLSGRTCGWVGGWVGQSFVPLAGEVKKLLSRIFRKANTTSD